MSNPNSPAPEISESTGHLYGIRQCQALTPKISGGLFYLTSDEEKKIHIFGAGGTGSIQRFLSSTLPVMVRATNDQSHHASREHLDDPLRAHDISVLTDQVGPAFIGATANDAGCKVAENPMALWIELRLKFEDVYRAEIPDDGLIRRFYHYVRWCMKSPGEGKYLSDVGTAVAVAFYEHLPQTGVIRRDMHRWLTRDEFSGLREMFRYHLSEEEFARFESEFLAQGRDG
jgi:hypothetical protein